MAKSSIQSDLIFMREALRLARKAVGCTSPNPAVGAVLVKQGAVVGRGFHRRAGQPHAEVEAIRSAGKRAKGATLYVTLEPCNHFGQTPPCCDAIIAAGIKRVVAAIGDPNPTTCGRGLNRLRRAGIRVTPGVLAPAARLINAPFFKVMEQGLPFVRLKLAQSLDGKIATASGQSRWISSPESRVLVHQWRRQFDAVLVGVNTVIKDDPLLTARLDEKPVGRQPIKIILDAHLRTPVKSRCLSRQSPAPTWIASRSGLGARARALRARGAAILETEVGRSGRIALKPLFQDLAARGIQSILIEGGAEVAASALNEKLVDQVSFFVSPSIIGGKQAPGSIGGAGASRIVDSIKLYPMTVSWVGEDLCVEGSVLYPSRIRAR